MDSGGLDRASGSTSTPALREIPWTCGFRGVALTDCSELAREKMWARIYLIPALQAEEDRDQVRRYLADRAREKELLGTETRVYNSDRYVLGCSTVGRRQLTTRIQVRSTYLCDHTGTRDEVGAIHCVGHVHINTETVVYRSLHWSYFTGSQSSNQRLICVHIWVSKQWEEPFQRFSSPLQ
jgi:hypothetical protein